MNQEEITQEIIHQKIKNAYPLKILFILGLTVAFIFYRSLYNGADPTCLIDHIHELTFPINRAIANQAWVYVLGLGQILTDFWVITIIIYWILKSQNFRVPTTVAILYSIRTLYMSLIKFPFPNNLIWKNPGFFTLTVPYDHTRDFFYSGHTTTITIVTLQFWACQAYPLAILSTFSFLYICSMLVTVRVHYSIDVIAAIIYCLFFHNFGRKYVYYCDLFWSAPYSLALFIFRIFFDNKEKEQNGTSMLQEEDQIHKNNNKIIQQQL